jgi:hypothetical protein
MRYAIALLFALLVAPLHAQTVDAKANLTWALPTQYTDGKAIPAGAITTVQVWAKTTPIADTDTSPTVVLPGAPTSHVWTGQVPNGATLYFRHKVCTATACSAFGPQASKGVKVDIPAVPSGITVTVTVTVSGP